MTVRFGRACFAAFATAASLMPLVSAQATEQAAPQAGVEGAQKPAAEPGRYTPPTKEENMVSCMALWDPGTHMSKTQWKTVCLRIQTDR